jgi:iron complex outermembrane recepter protein
LVASLSSVALFKYDTRVAAQAPVVELLDNFGYPINLRGRASVGYTLDAFSINAALNYSGDYKDTLVSPVRKIRSNETVDLSASYKFADAGPAKGTALSLSVRNLFDRDPPFANVVGGFDLANASPLGRVVAVQIAKAW